MGILLICSKLYIFLMIWGCIITAGTESAQSLQPDTTQQATDTLKSGQENLKELVPYVDRVQAESKREEELLYVLLIGISVLLSEDLAGIGAGLMVSYSMIPLTGAILGVSFFILLFDTILFMIGKTLGMGVFRIRPFSWFLKEEHIIQAKGWFDRKGPVLLILSRIIPGSRIPVYLAAGMLKTRFSVFMLYFGLPVLVWTPILIVLSKVLGEEMLQYYRMYEGKALWGFLLLILLIFSLAKMILPRLKNYLNS